MTFCFLNSQRKCRRSCAAFRINKDKGEGCVLLRAGDAVILLSSFLTKPKSVTKHPTSASPPEVNP